MRDKESQPATTRDGVHRGNGIPCARLRVQELEGSLLLSYKSVRAQGNKDMFFWQRRFEPLEVILCNEQRILAYSRNINYEICEIIGMTVRPLVLSSSNPIPIDSEG